MIVDVLPNQYETLARKHNFCPWQVGLLGELHNSSSMLITINMGRQAGHTYFARIAASSEFPKRTKVYIAHKKNYAEYANLLFDHSKVHEPIGLIADKFVPSFRTEVDFVIFDMNNEHPKQFEVPIAAILSALPTSARLVLLQPKFI